MPTAVEIANMALLRVGSEPIVALTDTTDRAKACNTAWPFARRTVLRAHTWNVATARDYIRPLDDYVSVVNPAWDYATVYPLPANCLAVLECDTDYQWRVEHGPTGTATTVAAYLSSQPTITSAGTVQVVTTAAHGLSDGDLVYLSDADDASLELALFRVFAVTSSTFEIRDIDTTGFTGGSSGGSVVQMSEGPVVVTDQTGRMGIRYIIDIDDPSAYDPDLTQVLAVRLAYEISEKLTGNRVKRKDLLDEYVYLLNEARMSDGHEQSEVSDLEEDDWITARY